MPDPPFKEIERTVREDLLPGLAEREYRNMSILAVWNPLDQRYYVSSIVCMPTGELLWPANTEVLWKGVPDA